MLKDISLLVALYIIYFFLSPFETHLVNSVPYDTRSLTLNVNHSLVETTQCIQDQTIANSMKLSIHMHNPQKSQV